jgi:hypothetical protein
VNGGRHAGGIFTVVLGPSFATCDACRAHVAGTRCWRWWERGQFRYGCRLCCFSHARIGGQAA